MQRHAFEVDVEEIEGLPVVRASGEMDLATIPELRAVVTALADREPPAILFDFSEISYLDSSGLGILVSAKRRLGPAGEVVVVTTASSVLKAMTLLGLDQIIRVFPNKRAYLETRAASRDASAA